LLDDKIILTNVSEGTVVCKEGDYVGELLMKLIEHKE